MEKQPEVLMGWDEIAAALGVTVRAAQERAKRQRDPVPVRVGHRGPWAFRSAIRDWVHRQDLPYQAALALRASSSDVAPFTRRKNTEKRSAS